MEKIIPMSIKEIERTEILIQVGQKYYCVFNTINRTFLFFANTLKLKFILFFN